MTCSIDSGLRKIDRLAAAVESDTGLGMHSVLV